MLYLCMDALVVYPEYVIKSLRESLDQACQGQLTPYTSIMDMLNHNQQ